MSQIYSSHARYPKGREPYISAYSGRPFSWSTGRFRPDTHSSRATTTTEVPNVKHPNPKAPSKAQSRSPPRQAPTTEHFTQRSNAPSQSKASTRKGSLVPVSRKHTGDDVNSMMSGYSGHGAEPGDGAQVGDLSESNVRDLGPSTGGGRSVLNSWVGGSLQSAKAGRFYEVVEYRQGLGNRRK